LFSEFAFDLPGTLPETLQAVPRAPAEARTIVEDTCERLRTDPRTKAAYVDRAAQVQTEREALKASRLYRLITENTTDLISRHTPDGHFLDASPASWTLLGFWPETLRGTPVQALFHEHDRQHLIDSTREALELDGYHTMTYRIRHRDGHYLWFETASRAIRETYTGTVVEVVSVSRDITARVLAEENKRRLAEVVEANTDLVLFIDPDGQLTHLNPSARHALNIDEQQALPALDQLLAQDDLQRLRNGGWHTADSQGVWSAEARLLPLGQRADRKSVV
jgi:PAS domain S-box-containing protein